MKKDNGLREMWGWVFFPTDKDRQKHWVYPVNYVRAPSGDVRVKLKTDTRMDDEDFYEPGWKRFKQLDGDIYE